MLKVIYNFLHRIVFSLYCSMSTPYTILCRKVVQVEACCPILATVTSGIIYNFVPGFNNGSTILSVFV